MENFNFKTLYKFFYALLLIWFAFLSFYSIQDISPAQLGYGYVFWLFHIIVFFLLVLLNPIHKWYLHVLFILYFTFIELRLNIPWGNNILVALVGTAIITLFFTRKIRIEITTSIIGLSIALIWIFLIEYFDLW